MKDRVTIENLLKRKESFFVSYEVNVDMWDVEDFDPEVDFFDLEDMLASRYWLKRLEAAGKLRKEESEKLSELEQRFRELGIPEFVKTRFPGVYERWIEKELVKEPETETIGFGPVQVGLEQLLKDAGWTGVAIPSGGEDEIRTLQPAAA